MTMATRTIYLLLLGIALIAIALFFVLPRSSSNPVTSNQTTIEQRQELERKAAKDDPVAQYALTLLVDDPVRQRGLLRKSADAGYPPAVMTLAVSLMSENHEEKAGARKMLEGIAQRGYYPAVVELSRCLSQGLCGDASQRDALMWSVVSRLLTEEKKIEANLLKGDELKLRAGLTDSEINRAQSSARLIAEKIHHVTH